MSFHNTTADPAATMDIARHDYLVLKGLLYGIAAIQSLPDDKQERADMLEMCAKVRQLEAGALVSMLRGVESHVGREIDLWPPHGGGEAGGNYTEQEIDIKDEVRNRVRDLNKQFEESGRLLDAPCSNVVTFI